jgi:putative FmdB family regulatory protein
MPIYEYRCKSCGRITSALILRQEDEASLRCGHCKSVSLDRIFSRFAVHKTEQQRVNDFDIRSSRGDDFYRDDRNVGLWAKKRLKQMGVDLGSQFEETVEKARSGKLREDDILGS